MYPYIEDILILSILVARFHCKQKGVEHGRDVLVSFLTFGDDHPLIITQALNRPQSKSVSTPETTHNIVTHQSLLLLCSPSISPALLALGVFNPSPSALSAVCSSSSQPSSKFSSQFSTSSSSVGAAAAAVTVPNSCAPTPSPSSKS